MYKFCTTLFVLLFCGASFSQEDNITSLLAQAEEVLYSDPREAIGIAQYVSKKSNDKLQLAEATLLLARGLYMEGKYDQALKVALEHTGKSASSPVTSIQINELLSKIFREMKLYDLSSLYLERATKFVDKESESDIQYWLEAKMLQQEFLQNSEEIEQASTHLYEAEKKLKKITKGKYASQIGNLDIDLAHAHLQRFQLDSAHFYIKEAFRDSKNKSKGNYLEMKTLMAYGDYLFLTAAHNTAIDTLKSALKIAEKFTNIPEQIAISEAIAENYLVTNNLEGFSNYNQKAIQLTNLQGDSESLAVNTAYNFLSVQESEKLNLLHANFRRMLFMLSCGLLLILMAWGFFKFRYHSKIKQYQKFLGFLETRQESDTSITNAALSQPRTLNIPKEAEEQLLKKLAHFEQSREFTKKETSLSRLALQFETNTKYLSELINTHKQKNFNSYINELRISYIIDKLKNNPTYLQYKISYLAEESGFSSHSVFATVFKGIAGISPTAFISILQKKDNVSEISKNEI